MADILFISSVTKLSLSQESNGTLLLATKLLQADYDVQILRFGELKTSTKDYENFICEITSRILEIAPKCVSFYTLWPYYHVVLRIASEIKRADPSIIVILGGPQASATAEDTLRAMPFVDYICSGEGENTVVPFFDALLRNDGAGLSEIPGLYHRVDGKIVYNAFDIPLCDLNTLPHWDDRLLPDFLTEDRESMQSSYYYMPIDAGRGCPYSCTFCCTSYFWKRMYRLKSPQRIVEDIRYYNEKYGITSFWFSHDAFTVDKKLVCAVCDEIEKNNLNIQWRCTSRIDCLTEELILKMKRAGMVEIELGIETGSPRMQKLINKNLNLTKAKETLSFLLKNGIRVGLFFMYGFPEETEDDLNQTLELLFTSLDLGVKHASMSFCRFNPTTAITEQFGDQLVLDPEAKFLYRGIDGYHEELPMIQANKSLFPFFYTMYTPVRDNYHYAFILEWVYQKFPRFARYVRGLYHGDNLQFYRDFVRVNQHIFDDDITVITKNYSLHSFDMLSRVLDLFDLPYIPILKEALRFENDLSQVKSAKEPVTKTETYGFSYLDYQRKLPIEQYSVSKTTILLQNIDRNHALKILNIE